MGRSARDMGTQPLRDAKQMGREARDRPLRDAKQMGRGARDAGTQPLRDAKDRGRSARDAGRDIAGAPRREGQSRLAGLKGAASDARRGRIQISTERRGGGKPPTGSGEGEG